MKLFVATLIYVDNVVIVGNDGDKIQNTKKKFDKRYGIKDP